jgi:hypothetical protein
MGFGVACLQLALVSRCCRTRTRTPLDDHAPAPALPSQVALVRLLRMLVVVVVV